MAFSFHVLQHRQPDFSKVPRTAKEVCNLVNCLAVITFISILHSSVLVSNPIMCLVLFFFRALSALPISECLKSFLGDKIFGNEAQVMHLLLSSKNCLLCKKKAVLGGI